MVSGSRCSMPSVLLTFSLISKLYVVHFLHPTVRQQLVIHLDHHIIELTSCYFYIQKKLHALIHVWHHSRYSLAVYCFENFALLAFHFTLQHQVSSIFQSVHDRIYISHKQVKLCTSYHYSVEVSSDHFKSVCTFHMRMFFLFPLKVCQFCRFSTYK